MKREVLSTTSSFPRQWIGLPITNGGPAPARRNPATDALKSKIAIHNFFIAGSHEARTAPTSRSNGGYSERSDV